MAGREGSLESLVILNSLQVFSGRRVLVTGHTGFKGAWLSLWLHRLGAEVHGISLAPITEPNLYNLSGLKHLIRSHMLDIRQQDSLQSLISAIQPEIVFHLAAQALVRASYRSPLETFATNVMGTANLLETLRTCPSVKSIVVVTTDKVYENLEQGYPFREQDALGGHDPYSSSKACAELVTACYRQSFLKAQGARVVSARAGNVIGGGDWAEDRLIPDAVRAWQSKIPLVIRSPFAIRPWQHVLEPVHAYLVLAAKILDRDLPYDSFNFGPESHAAATVRKVVDLARETYGSGEVQYMEQNNGPKEAGWLSLETSRARFHLGIHPVWDLTTAVTKTMNWYRELNEGKKAIALCEQDLVAFEEALLKCPAS